MKNFMKTYISTLFTCKWGIPVFGLTILSVVLGEKYDRKMIKATDSQKRLLKIRAVVAAIQLTLAGFFWSNVIKKMKAN